jgi:pimeloyl-ACP methyl ester carboxylesterase
MSAAADDGYEAAYDAALARWPQPVEQRDVGTPFGSTHLLVAGPADGTPVMLLPGGGATATAWWANVADLTRAGHRVIAVDPLTDAGRSVPAGRGLRAPDDVAAWFLALLDGLQLPRVRLVGHSYGAWTALHCTLAHPDRVQRLVLLDPTSLVSGLAPRYLLRALPMLARPSDGRVRSLLSWETGGRAIDPDWVRLWAAGLAQRRRPVRPRRPPAAALRELAVPTLAVVGAQSRAHDPEAVAGRLRQRLPGAAVHVLPGASHHTLPALPAAELDALLVPFLADGVGGRRAGGWTP